MARRFVCSTIAIGVDDRSEGSSGRHVEGFEGDGELSEEGPAALEDEGSSETET